MLRPECGHEAGDDILSTDGVRDNRNECSNGRRRGLRQLVAATGRAVAVLEYRLRSRDTTLRRS
jgi:hypothetical protein